MNTKNSLFICFLFLGTVLFSQTAGINTALKTLINQSFTYFPKMKELQQQVQTNQYREAASKSGYQPTVSANLGYVYVAPVSQMALPLGMPPYPVFSFQPNNNFNTALTLNQTLWDFGKVKTSVEKAKDEIKISNANIEASKSTLAAQVSTIFYSILYLHKAIGVQDSMLNTLYESKKIMDSRVKNGDALELDALTVKNNIDNANNRKADLQNMLDKQNNLLYYTTGQNMTSVTAQALFDFNVASAEKDSVTASAQKWNSEVVLAKLHIEQARHEISSTKAAALPVLSVLGGLGYKNGYLPDLNQIRFNYLVGINLSVPLYQGGRYIRQTKVAESTLLQSQFSLESTHNNLRKDILQTLDDIRLNEEKIVNTRSMIIQAQTTLQLAQSKYRNGTAIYVELFTAQNNLLAAQLSRLSGINYWQ